MCSEHGVLMQAPRRPPTRISQHHFDGANRFLMWFERDVRCREFFPIFEQYFKRTVVWFIPSSCHNKGCYMRRNGLENISILLRKFSQTNPFLIWFIQNRLWCEILSKSTTYFNQSLLRLIQFFLDWDVMCVKWTFCSSWPRYRNNILLRSADPSSCDAIRGIFIGNEPRLKVRTVFRKCSHSDRSHDSTTRTLYCMIRYPLACASILSHNSAVTSIAMWFKEDLQYMEFIGRLFSIPAKNFGDSYKFWIWYQADVPWKHVTSTSHKYFNRTILWLILA